MKELFHIVEGALLSVMLTGSLGWLILSRTRLRMWERWPAAFACGVPLAEFLAPMRRGVLLWASILLTLLAIWRRRVNHEQEDPRPRWLLVPLGLGVAVFAWLTASHTRPTPAGLDDAGLLWAMPARFGGAPAVVLLHAIFLLALGFSIFEAARRWMRPVGAVTAALLVWTAPPVWTLAGMSGSQGVYLYCLFGAVWLAGLAIQTRQWWLGVWAAVLALHCWTLAGISGGSVFSGFVFLHLPWVSLPFAALGLGWLVQRQAIAGAVLVGFQIATLWPGLAPAQDLTQGVEEARMVERSVGPKARILSEIPLARSQMTHTVSQDAELLAMLQRTSTRWPTVRMVVPEADRRSYVLTQERFMGEVQFYLRDKEIPRSPRWRVSRPEVFDNRVVTGCKCRVEIDFGEPVRFDQIQLMGSRPGLRREAVIVLRDLGYTHILVREGGPLGDELHRHAAYWGVKETGQHEEVHLFALE